MLVAGEAEDGRGARGVKENVAYGPYSIWRNYGEWKLWRKKGERKGQMVKFGEELG